MSLLNTRCIMIYCVRFREIESDQGIGMVYFDCHLANTDTTKIVTPEITTNGPVGRFR